MWEYSSLTPFCMFLQTFCKSQHFIIMLTGWTWKNMKVDFSFHGVSLGTDSPLPSTPPPPPIKQTTTQQFLLSPEVLKILTSPPSQTKSLDNSNTLIMFNNNTYTNFKTAYKYMLILSWCHAQELFWSQILVTTVEFQLWISCIWSSYLTH